MPESPWDPQELDPSVQRVLSGKEREYLMYGDPGPYTFADMDRRVEKKVELLPERVQQLIDDVCLLYFGDHIREDTGELWEEVSAVSNRSQKVREERITRTRKEAMDPGGELGFELGNVVRMISDDGVSPDFLWGVIIGLVGEPESNYGRECEKLVELFEELENRYEWRIVSAGQQAQSDDGFRQEREEIREILQDEGYAPASPLVTTVLLEYTSGDSAIQSHDSEKSWRADPDEVEPPKPPDDMPTPAEMRQHSISRVVERLAQQTPLREIDRLAKDLREDAIRIQQRQWRGVDPVQAICFVAEHGETQIQEFQQTEQQGQNNMTTALRRLAYQDSTWVNQPVLEENEGENSYWDLTPYGQLLYQVCVEHNGSTSWMYENVDEPEKMDRYMRELVSG